MLYSIKPHSFLRRFYMDIHPYVGFKILCLDMVEAGHEKIIDTTLHKQTYLYDGGFYYEIFTDLFPLGLRMFNDKSNVWSWERDYDSYCAWVMRTRL